MRPAAPSLTRWARPIRAGRWLAAIATFAVAFTWLVPAAHAQGYEQISSYDETVLVRPDGTLEVTEQIAYDFGGTPHHGIVRDIPTVFPLDSTFDRVTPIDVLGVEATGGASAGFDVSTGGGVTTIKIGDASATVTGPHTYTLHYLVHGTINDFADHEELYWNAVGPNWAVTISNVHLSVSAPAILKVVCFQGAQGSQLPCDRARHRAGGATASFGANPLFPYQGLSAVISMPKGSVAVKILKRERWSLGRAFSVAPGPAGAAGVLLIVLVGGFVLVAWRRGRDRVFVGSDVDKVLGAAPATKRCPSDRQARPPRLSSLRRKGRVRARWACSSMGRPTPWT